MNDQQIKRLRFHLFQIANSFTSELSETNTVLALGENNEVTPEAACNHHLIDLLCQLSPAIFIYYCEAIFEWLADSKHGYSGHPFALDSYTLFCERNEDNTRLFQENIIDHQLVDGAIPVYTAFVQGGDFFSTLWATKILIQYDKDKFDKNIRDALNYLVQKHTVGARSIAQQGYLLYLLLLFKPEEDKNQIIQLFDTVQTVGKDICFDKSVGQNYNDIYLLEDLLQYCLWTKSESTLALIEEKLILLFELDSEPNIPAHFKEWSSTRPQQPYYLMLLKSAVLAAKYLRAIECPLPTLELNSHLHGTYRQIKYLGMRADRELKHYKAQYDSIESEFSRYEAALRTMWERTESEYERSIFLMMPFKGDMEYRALTDEIRKVCASVGFKAFRVDDEFRSPFDGLWDNIVLNMLGCKFGVSVYVTEKAVDKLTDELRFFENPNVALEFGFMKSRGKKVLVLKDKNSRAPSDLQGFVWKPFDIKNPDKTVAAALSPWLKEITPKTKNEKKNTDKPD